MLVAPERRMSSCVMTKMAAAASATFCVRLDTDVTCMFIRSSTLMVVTSIAFCAGALATNSSATMASATARRTCLAEPVLVWLLVSISMFLREGMKMLVPQLHRTFYLFIFSFNSLSHLTSSGWSSRAFVHKGFCPATVKTLE